MTSKKIRVFGYSMDEPHIDAHNMAYIIMFWEGLGNLFPWNAFITAAGYFATRFCGTPFEDNFENFFSISFMCAQTVGLALAVKYGNMMTLRTRIIYPLFWYSAIFLMTTAFVLDTVMDPTLLFYLTLLSTIVCGVSGAILSGGLFGLAAVMPPVYTGAVMNGQGLAGLTVSIASIVTILAADPVDNCSTGDADTGDTCAYDVDWSAFAYFSIATFALLTCVMVFEVLCALPFTHFHLARSGNAIKDSPTLNPLLEEQEYERLEEDTITLDHFEETIQNEEKKRLSSLHDYSALSDAELDGKVEEIAEARGHFSGEEIWRVFSTIRTPALSVWFVFTVTIGLFPSITVLFESEHACNNIQERFFNDIWTPFFFLLFNLFDFIGRWSASKISFSFLNAHNIWIPVVGRLIFFPLFLLCRITDSQLPTIFMSDAWPICFMIIFSLTNGYLSTMCMMLGPSLTEPRDSMLAGNIMVFCLTVGLFSGASVSFLSLLISQGSV